MCLGTVYINGVWVEGSVYVCACGVRGVDSGMIRAIEKRLVRGSRPDLCQDPKKIQDPGSTGSKIWDPAISTFSFNGVSSLWAMTFNASK